MSSIVVQRPGGIRVSPAFPRPRMCVGALFATLILASAPASAQNYKQHTNTEKFSGNASTLAKGTYRAEASLRIQSAHVTDRPHPYEAPEPGWIHHHDAAPARFNFLEHFFVDATGGAGSESAILAGSPTSASSDNPYSSTYRLRFRKEGNAEFVLDDGHNWTGNIQVIQGGNLTGFGFTVFGSGLNLTWNTPSGVGPFILNFSGDVDSPTFDFTYADGFSMDRAVLSIAGWVRAPRRQDEFGRIYTDATASILEDTDLLGNVGFNGVLRPGVYDVEHGLVPEPATWVMMIAGFGLIGAAKRVANRRARRGYSAAYGLI